MTTRNVFTIFLLIVMIFAADALWFHWGLPVFIGKQFVGFVEYLSFFFLFSPLRGFQSPSKSPISSAKSVFGGSSWL